MNCNKEKEEIIDKWGKFLWEDSNEEARILTLKVVKASMGLLVFDWNMLPLHIRQDIDKHARG